MTIGIQDKRSRFFPFHYWHAPTADDVGATATEFLQMLEGPAHIFIPGRDASRCRAVVTLLHGNEPSGLIGLHHLLRRSPQPAVDLHCFVVNVAAAKAAPGFFYRMLPGEADLNRCFKPPYTDSPISRLAKGLLDTLEQLQPEAVIDIHNTSGSGPGFGVTTFMDPRHEALVSLFTHRIIVTDLSLGALMEISESRFPTVTVECGGAQDLESHRLAEDGLAAYAERQDVLTPPAADFSLEFFYNPIRLEMREGVTVDYRKQASAEHDITLLPEVEHHNFGYVEAGTVLGFVRGELQALLTARDSHGNEKLSEFFAAPEGNLVPTRTLKLFMVTTNPEIASKDCLFYLVPAEDNLSVVHQPTGG
ncbi:succinylglutamate desuccinylase [Proteobacteria bacterium 005FR1]|nr:succinylglutamate desuccinylase [Proteobacteria bacterium 005FR1]